MFLGPAPRSAPSPSYALGSNCNPFLSLRKELHFRYDSTENTLSNDSEPAKLLQAFPEESENRRAWPIEGARKPLNVFATTEADGQTYFSSSNADSLPGIDGMKQRTPSPELSGIQPDPGQSSGEQQLERNTAFEISDNSAASSAGMQLCGMVTADYAFQASEPMSNPSHAIKLVCSKSSPELVDRDLSEEMKTSLTGASTMNCPPGPSVNEQSGRGSTCPALLTVGALNKGQDWDMSEPCEHNPSMDDSSTVVSIGADDHDCDDEDEDGESSTRAM
jgi:hypothetical protein